MSLEQEEISIFCDDNVRLSGTFFKPKSAIKAAIMICPATGIKRQFYTNFAYHLAENGFAIITYDNRGIGESLNGSLKKSDISLQDWGILDMTAVLNELKKRYSNTTYHIVGHSAGGQLIGLMPNANELSSMFNFACSSGRTANMKFPFILQAYFFMNIFIPLNNSLFGYTNAHWVGMGEPLPKKVAQQWKEWCNGKGYVKTAFNKTIHEHWYDVLNFPSLWVNATDDNIAIDKNVSDMIDVFQNLPAERLTLKPNDFGLKEIGHMKFFSRKNKILWKLAVNWFEKNTK